MPETDTIQSDTPNPLSPKRSEAAKGRAVGFRRRAEAPTPPGQGLLTDTLEELNATVEELRVAEEEMRVQNEELLRTRLRVEAERHRYQDLFDLAPDGYLVTTLDGKILEANRAASQMLGIAPRFLKSRALATLVASENLPAYSAALKALAAFPAPGQSSAPEPPQERALRLRRRHAGLFHAAVTVVPVPPLGKQPATLRWLIRDITERRIAEEERLAFAHTQAVQAEAAGRQTAVILDTITEMFVTLDRDWRFTYFNASAACQVRASGHDPDALLGQTIWDAFPTAFGPDFQAEALRAAETHQSVEFEGDSLGLGRRLQVRVFPSEDGVTVYSLDITARRKAEGEA